MEEPVFSPYQQNEAVANEDLPNSTGILVLGILSIVLVGVIGAILAIIALSMWGNTKEVYREAPQRYSAASYSRANAGRICAIVGLSLLGLAVLVILAIIAIIA